MMTDVIILFFMGVLVATIISYYVARAMMENTILNLLEALEEAGIIELDEDEQ